MTNKHLIFCENRWLDYMKLNANESAFFILLRAGMWGDLKFKDDSLKFKDFQSADWASVYQLAQEQAVQGLVLQGIERLRTKGLELSVPKVLLLQWIGEVQIIEQRNKEMNSFMAELFVHLREAGIDAVLVKGQGIGQCYERPLWRSSGDVDLLLTEENYFKARTTLKKIAESSERETAKNIKRLHQGFVIDAWTVELHGTMHANLSREIDREIDEVQKVCFVSTQLLFKHSNK